MNKRGTGIAISYCSTIVNMVTGLVLSSFLLRTLGDTEYGLYQTIASFANYLVLLEFGTGTITTRNVAFFRDEHDERMFNRVLSTMLTITILFSALIAVVSAVFYVNIGVIYAKTMDAAQIQYAKRIFLFLVAHILLVFVTQTFDGFLLGMKQYTFTKIRSVINTLIRFGLLLLVIWFRRSALCIVIIDVSLNAIMLLITVFFSVRHYAIRYVPRETSKKILLNSLPLCFALLLQAIINQANNNVDKFVIGVMRSVQDVALYSVTQYFFSMFSTIMTIPIPMYLPEVVETVRSGAEGKALTDSMISPCRLGAIIGGTVLFGFISVGRPFISLAYGADKTDAWLYAVVIMLPMFINMTNAVVLNVLQAMNKLHVRSIVLSFTAGLNIVATVLLIRRIGIIGAVLATAASLLIGNILIMNLYYKKSLHLQILRLFSEAYRGILPFQLLACAIGWAATQIIENQLLSVIVGGVLFLGVSLFLIFRFGLRTEEKAHASRLLRRLHIGRPL